MLANKTNIVLIGMPGAGKSTLGVVLAKIMNKDFLDADLLIQGLHGATLQQLIDQRGADGFIALEGQALQTIDVQNTVIATGGSAVYSHAAMLHLAESGIIVYLKISYESLVARLGDLNERGVVLRDGTAMSLRDLYDERQPIYERYTELTVDVDNLDITTAARKVAATAQASGEA